MTNAAELVDAKIETLNDWRGEMLSRLRALIKGADPDVVEAWKYMGSPVWSCEGTIAVGNAHKEKVKLTFAHGASLPDPHRLFNNGFGGKVWRAIDLVEDDTIDARAFQALVRAVIAHNRSKPKMPRKASARA